MGSFTTVKAADGHELQAYVATPEGTPVGGLVVVQEIFGVNKSIRGVADAYAKDGFVAVAPAIFDRYERDLELGYEGEDMKKAYELYGKLNPDTVLLDVAAAFEEAKARSGKDVGVLGFCFGGRMSWLAATRGEMVKIQPACTVGYYAGGVGNVATEEPSCPVLLHFGGADTHIGSDQIEAVRTAHPEVEIHLYEGALHGFANEMRAEYDQEAAKLARERSLTFLKTHIA
ncbi:dienelactone hydrolase family protein [Granulicella arctica]|uniref:Carboxymethylenebutenolidase n=1 Tax=Granulicella arctica TaxID=940613 RepID=A0A7Y9PJD9_9BACT|nr:dienelactone hydrolase family protein [Granulicella arctica]NYF80163.1 carboxymethylenebutenolidase [Granulicella arctica]